MTAIQVAPGVTLGGNGRLVLIAGPCVIESRTLCLKIARTLVTLTGRLGIPFIFKASFDKANRTSGTAVRGPGMKQGLAILAAVKRELGVPVTTDIHLPAQAAAVADVVDLIQIPAFLCRQTDLLEAAAATGLPVNVKKGQFLSPEEVRNIIAKVTARKKARVCITERGTSFGYNRLINDFTGIPIMRAMGAPVIFDATHSVQRPGGQGDRSGGAREFVSCLARAAAAVGIDGLFIETHPDPDHAASDGPNMVPLAGVEDLLQPVLAIDRVVKGR
ncbi:MAG: 3-deoxy-8-phosphooctulonate synthase [Planctomycetota bacterium]